MYATLFARAQKRCQEPFPNFLDKTYRKGGKRFLTPFLPLLCALAWASSAGISASAQEYQSPSLILKLSGRTDKLELTTNSSRILTLDKNIPRVQVNNPDLLAVTPLSANQVQISAKKAGVTQVNLWDEDGNIHTVDILIYGDVRELEVALVTQFPNSTIKVYRYSESLVLKGFVDKPEQVSQITQLAADYAPKVINNITVGGVQQVLLKVKVMEVSRTKLRRMGTDFTYLDSSGGFLSSSISGLLSNTTNSTGGGLQSVVDTGGQTVEFGIVNGGNAFFGFLDWLQQNNIAKILAEPNIVAVSGRPAQFNVGGEIPIIVPQSLGTASIEFKKFGTQVDFLPIVLGNGNVRLEVRPRISEIDDSRSVVLQNFVIPALTVREVDTAVEMKAGQTFALAGLVQERTESISRGWPYVSALPIIGVPFRKVAEEVNEIELLILVTPEFVDALEPHQVDCGGPGYATTSPTNSDLYCGGHLEVSPQCNPIRGMTACGECSTGGCGPNGPMGNMITDGVPLPGGTGYDDSYMPTPMGAPPAGGQLIEPESLMLPPAGASGEALPSGRSTRHLPPPAASRQAVRPAGDPLYTVPRPYSPQRQPSYVRNSTSPDNRQGRSDTAASPSAGGGLIGPVGYEAQ